MPTKTIVLATTNKTAVILDAARGMIEGELERMLRKHSNKGIVGKVGNIERTFGGWVSTDVLRAMVKKMPIMKGAIGKSFSHAQAKTADHWLCFHAKWFVEDLFTQPIFDDDDCDVSGKVFLVWSVKGDQLLIRTASVRIRDVNVETGISLTGGLIGFLRALIRAFELGNLAVVDSTQLASIPAQLGVLIGNARKKLPINARLVDVWIDGAKPRFSAKFEW